MGRPKKSDRFLGRSLYKDGSQVTIIVIFPDFEKNKIVVCANEMPIRNLDDTDEHSFILNIPSTANSYLIFCKAEATVKGEVTSSIATKAMQLYKAGRLSESLNICPTL